jgi:hypothetical protein
VLVKPPSALSAASSMLSMTSNKTKVTIVAQSPVSHFSVFVFVCWIVACKVTVVAIVLEALLFIRKILQQEKNKSIVWMQY